MLQALENTESSFGTGSDPTMFDAPFANGNRDSVGYTVGTGGTLTASPNATYTYDSAGHLTAKTDTSTGKVTTFAYDHRDRLVGITRKTSGGTVDYRTTYVYDALNRRIAEQVDADGAGAGSPVTTWTVFDGVNPYADFDGAGSLAERYLHGAAVDALLARSDASGVTDWYLTDRLGSVRDIVDTSGTVLYHTGYDSFGNKVSTTGSGGDRFGFTGREYDAALNLYYYRARFYDPATGRFLSKDPIGFEAGDANLYRYVGNGPTNGVDPSGHEDRVPILSPGPGRVVPPTKNYVGGIIPPSTHELINDLEFQMYAKLLMQESEEGDRRKVHEVGAIVWFDRITGRLLADTLPRNRGQRDTIKFYPFPRILPPNKGYELVAIIHTHPDPRGPIDIGPSETDMLNSGMPYQYPGSLHGRIFPWIIYGRDIEDNIYKFWVFDHKTMTWSGGIKDPSIPVANDR